MEIAPTINCSSELSLILLCACTNPDEYRKKEIENIVASSIDWGVIYNQSLIHKVFPLLYNNIKSILPDYASEETINKFKSTYLTNAKKNLRYAAFLVKLINFLQSYDIAAVPFKGPVLAQDMYNNIELRQFSDLDILVSTCDAVKAWNILENNGFQPELNLSNSQKLKYIKSEDHIPLSKNNICVELHWEMSGLYIQNPLVYEDISKNITKIKFLNTKISNLGLEHLLVYLCIHGAKHGWENIESVSSIASIIYKELNWKLVETISLKWKCHTILRLGLYLSWRLLNAPIPNDVIQTIKIDKTILKLYLEVISCLSINNTNLKAKDISDRFSLFHIRIRDSFADKLRYIFRLIFRSTDKEWLYYPVPGYLSFLHYFLRPYRLAITLFRK